MEESEQQQADCTKASEMALGTETVDGGPREVSHPGRGGTGAGCSEGTWEDLDLGGKTDM